MFFFFFFFEDDTLPSITTVTEETFVVRKEFVLKNIVLYMIFDFFMQNFNALAQTIWLQHLSQLLKNFEKCRKNNKSRNQSTNTFD